jgi:hypothetical protein
MAVDTTLGIRALLTCPPLTCGGVPRNGPAAPCADALIVDGALSHDGDLDLGPACRQRGPQGRLAGARLAKEHKDSPRRIEACVAAVIAVHRAAELADSTPASYAWWRPMLVPVAKTRAADTIHAGGAKQRALGATVEGPDPTGSGQDQRGGLECRPANPPVGRGNPRSAEPVQRRSSRSSLPPRRSVPTAAALPP